MYFNHLNYPAAWRAEYSKYPEGLTILESLMQWIRQVDDMVDSHNANQTTINAYGDRLDSFVTQFGEHLQATIVETLSEWQASGFLDVVIDAALQTEMDNLVTTTEQALDSFSEQLAETNNLRKASYITPYDFGAIGDGVSDDTNAIRRAIYESNQKGTILFFPSGCKCVVTDSLNVYNGQYYDVVLNLIGSLPKAKGSYAINEHGGIKLNSEGSLFKNTTVSGSISNMSIIGNRNEKYYFFDNCNLSRLIVDSNNITQFGAFLYDSSVSNVSRINENTFLTVFYFHKHNTIPKSLTDSFITNNYINGGAEVTDNACFEFDGGNGSVIQGNFIDYYHTIYRTHASGQNQMATSIGNHYQVFLYLYKFKPLNPVSFVSIADTFNWTDKSTLSHLQSYEEDTYQDEKGAIYSIPTYIFRPMENADISIQSGYIQSNVGNIVYLDTHTTEYKKGNSTAHFVNVDRYDSSKLKITKKRSSNPFYIGGEYRMNKSDPFFVIPVDELPSLYGGWIEYPTGTRVMFQNEEYRLVNQFNTDTQSMVVTWVKVAVT